MQWKMAIRQGSPEASEVFRLDLRTIFRRPPAALLNREAALLVMTFYERVARRGVPWPYRLLSAYTSAVSSCSSLDLSWALVF